MENVTSVQISKEIHKRLKILSVHNDKKLYELIEEAVSYLESKYNNERQPIRSNIESRE